MNLLRTWLLFILQVIMLHKCTVLAVPEESNSESLPEPSAIKSSRPESPQITLQPSNHIVSSLKTETVRLYCRASGFPSPTISWLKDGVPLENANLNNVIVIHTELMFLSVINKGEGANTGIYQCIASNSLGSALSRNASVQVASIREDFRVNPQDTVASLGGSTTIRCEGPRGIPDPNIRWRKDSKNLLIDRRMQVKPKGDLTINRLQKSDSGSYACVASNLAGVRISAAALLMVQEPPRFTTLPDSSSVASGSMVEFKCSAEGDPQPRITWSRAKGSMSERCVPVGNNLQIKNVQPEDEGEYVCTAENRAGKETAVATLTVQAKPNIVEISSDTTTRVGETVTLTCRVKATPKANVFWRNSQGEKMLSEKSTKNRRLLVMANGNLKIYNVRFADQGLYVCEAINPVGSTEDQVRLTVQSQSTSLPPPIIYRGPVNKTVPVNTDVTFACSSSSVPKPIIEWYKDGRKVETGSVQSHVTQLSSGNLQISNVQKSDAGQYMCKVSNSNGIAEWVAKLSVSDKTAATTIPFVEDDLPRSPGKPNMINSTSNCITVSWQPDSDHGASPIQYYMLEYYRLGSISSTWQRIAPVRNNIFKLVNLLPSSRYVVLVRTVNMQGVSDPSQVSEQMETKGMSNTPNKQLNALEAVTIQVTQAISLATSGERSVVLKWETEADCNTVDGFMVLAQPINEPSANLFSEEVDCRTMTFQLKKIVMGTIYEVRVQPVKGQYVGKPSPLKFLSLKAGIINPEPPVLTVKAETKKSEELIIFRWQPPPDIPADYIVSYELSYRATNNDTATSVTVNSSTTEMTLSNLREDVTYIAFVTYFTGLGAGLSSHKVTIGGKSSQIPDNSDGFGAILQQPSMIVGLAVALLVIIGLIVGGACYYKRSRRNNKSRGLHVRSFSFTPHSGNSRSNIQDRPSSNYPYSPGFQILKTDNMGTYENVTSNERGDNFGGQVMGLNNSSQVYIQRQTANNNGTHGHPGTTTMVTYIAKNGEIDSCVDSANIAMPKNQVPFSYVTDQLTSRTDIPPQFSRPSLSSTQSSTKQQMHQHQQQLSRQRSASSNVHGGSNHSDAELRHVGYSESNVIDLPPPPPSPPLSQRTAISDRSRSSSGMHSTGDRSSGSGQRSRRTGRGSRFKNSPGVHKYYNEKSPVVDNFHQASAPVRVNDPRNIMSSVPPTPPIRGASNFQYSHPIPSYNHNRDVVSNLGYLAGPSEGETDNETDRVAELRVRNCNTNRDPRDSLAVSGVSMMNGYGSETDDRGSFCDQDSSALSSDEESFHMESASQVGQSLLPEEETSKSCLTPQPRCGATQNNVSSSRQHSNTYQHHHASEEPLLYHNSGQSLTSEKGRSNRKSSGKTRQTKNVNTHLNRVNSASSSSSSYHHTGDSGMSAGVGCSTEHSSLNSSASGGSHGNKIKMNRSKTTEIISLPDAVTSYRNVNSLPALDINNIIINEIRTEGSNHSTPVSPAISGVSEQSGYVSTASSCWQYQPAASASKQLLIPRRQPRINTTGHSTSLQRPSDFPDSVNHPCNMNPKLAQSPHSKSLDKKSVYSEYDVTPTNFNSGISQCSTSRGSLGAEFVNNNYREKAQELSDVPEVSTSDFCEDYSDQSQ